VEYPLSELENRQIKKELDSSFLIKWYNQIRQTVRRVLFVFVHSNERKNIQKIFYNFYIEIKPSRYVLRSSNVQPPPYGWFYFSEMLYLY
jgi:hypothetical protein